MQIYEITEVFALQQQHVHSYRVNIKLVKVSIIIIIIIMWLVQWMLLFPQATSMSVNFVLNDRQLSDKS